MKQAVLLALIFASTAVWAQEQSSEGQSKIKVEDAKDSKNKVSGTEEISQEVTNPLLRAQMGSMSKYSMSFSVGYSGGSLAEPLAATRPDIYGTPDVQNATRLDSGINVRYRWSKNDSVTFGTSVGVSTPFYGHVNNTTRRGRPARENQYQIGDPTIGYNRTFAAFGMQNSLSASASYGSSVESQRTNNLGTFGLSYTFLKSFSNGLTLGLTNGLSGFTYDGSPSRDGAPLFRASFLPFVEYRINDKFSLRTISRYAWFQHTYGETDGLDWDRMLGSQSAGVQISLSPDIWIYPNMQWDWGTKLADLDNNTNLAISTIFNVF